MPRLPDVRIEDWLSDQQKRFSEATAGLWDATEFELGARQQEAQIPPDYDAVGGMDQWEQVEQDLLEKTYRAQQQADEERQRQEVEAQAEQYRQQQQQAEAQAALAQQAEQTQQQQQESSMMDLIRGMGIPTPGDAFESLKAPGDPTSSSGIFDVGAPPIPQAAELPQSDADAFNQFAGGMQTDAFGAPTPDPLADQPPPPDHTSTTGLFEPITGPIKRAATEIYNDPVGSVDRGLRHVIDTYGVGALERSTAEQGDIRREAEAFDAEQGIAPRSFRQQTMEPISPEYRAANPERATKFDEAQSEWQNLAMGASGGLGAGHGGVADDAIQAIKTLIKHGVGDDVVLAMERSLADKSDLALSAVQKLTRGIPEATPPWLPDEADRAEVARQDAEISGRPAHAGYLAEDVADAERATSGTPSALVDEIPTSERGVTPEEARQMGLPGFEDVPLDRRPEGTNVRGYGHLPQNVSPPPGYVSREGEELIREAVGGSDKLTRAQREQWAADLLDTNPERIRELLANAPDPVQAGVEQTALRMHAQTPLAALDEARVKLAELKQQVRDAEGAVPEAVQIDMAHAVNEFAIKELAARDAIHGPTAYSRAASKVLNAQKGAYEGVRAAEEAQRLENVGRAFTKAAKSAQKAARTGVVDEGVLKDLGEAADSLGSKRTREALARKSRTAAGEGGDGAGGTGRTRKPAGPKEPREETWAEKIGRLERLKSHWKNQLDKPGGFLDDATRADLQGRVAAVEEEIFDTSHNAYIDMLAQARDRLAAKQGREFTQEELERIANETVGRRTTSQISREVNREARGFNSQAAQQQKLLAELPTNLEAQLKKAFDRQFKDEAKLQQSIDRQISRRVDGLLAQEKRAQVRAEVKDMAQEAQIWAKRIQKMPEHREALQEELDVILGRMREHSNVGARVADDLAERLDVRLQEDVYQRAFRESAQATRATEDAHIQSVVDRIREIQNNARGPEVHLEVSKLFKELEEIGLAGKEKASSLRRQANDRGILKAGLKMEGESYEAVVKLLEDVDPADPNTLKPILALMKQPGLLDIINEISYVNLLSNPYTNIKNIGSTGSQLALKTLLRNPLEFVGSLGQTKGQIAALKGATSSVPEGAKLGWQTWKTGINPRRLEEATAKGEYQHIGREHLPAVMAEQGLPALFPLAAAKKLGGKMGEALHATSTRPLAAADAMLGHVAYQSAIWEKAQQRADDILRAGGDELDDLGAIIRRNSEDSPRVQIANHIINNIWDYPDIIREAGKIEDYSLFRTNRGKKTGLDLKMSNALRTVSAFKTVSPNASTGEKLGALVVNALLPFQDVPYNYTKQGLGNVAQGIASPVTGPAALLKSAAGAVRGGQAGADARQIGGERFARAAQGATLLAIPLMLANNEKDSLTGPGPRDPGKRRTWLLDHKANSYRLPYTDTWISYEGMPWGIPFAMVAGMKEAMDEAKDEPEESNAAYATRLGVGVGKGAIRGIASQSLIEPFMRNFEIVSGESGENNLAQTLAAIASRYSPHDLVVPAGSGMLGFLAGLADTVERDTGRARNMDEVPEVARNVLDSRIPGLRNELPERRDAYGNVMEKPRFRGLLGYEGTPPMSNDPITQHLEKAGVGIPNAPEAITYSGGKVPLTIREQARFQQYYGEEMRAYMEAYNVGHESYTPDELTKLRTRARKLAQDRILNEMSDEELNRRWREDPDELVAP